MDSGQCMEHAHVCMCIVVSVCQAGNGEFKMMKKRPNPCPSSAPNGDTQVREERQGGRTDKPLTGDRRDAKERRTGDSQTAEEIAVSDDQMRVCLSVSVCLFLCLSLSLSISVPFLVRKRPEGGEGKTHSLPPPHALSHTRT